MMLKYGSVKKVDTMCQPKRFLSILYVISFIQTTFCKPKILSWKWMGPLFPICANFSWKRNVALNLIPIAFNEALEGEIETFSLFVEKDNSLQIIWDSILASFTFFGEQQGISKCCFAGFIRLNKFLLDNSTNVINGGQWNYCHHLQILCQYQQ